MRPDDMVVVDLTGHVIEGNPEADRLRAADAIVRAVLVPGGCNAGLRFLDQHVLMEKLDRLAAHELAADFCRR